MYQLAKLGFTQSYTYFAWKNTSAELTEYFNEMMDADVFEYFRPNLWPNTPDILNEYLQKSGRAGFMTRLILAGTLSGSYGIYGPAYELCEGRPVREGSEEYLDSEKYQIRENSRALQQNPGLAFHPVENSQLIAYSKVTADKSDMILVVANLDPHNRQA